MSLHVCYYRRWISGHSGLPSDSITYIQKNMTIDTQKIRAAVDMNLQGLRQTLGSSTDYLRTVFVPAIQGLGYLRSGTSTNVSNFSRIKVLDEIRNQAGAQMAELADQMRKEWRQGNRIAPPAPPAAPAQDIHSAVMQNLSALQQSLQTMQAPAPASGSVSEDEIQELIDEAVAPVRDSVNDLETFVAGLNTTMATPQGRSRVMNSVQRSKNVILDKVLNYYPTGGDCTQCLVTSPPSYGKTFAIRKLGEQYDVFLKHSCAERETEEQILIGGPQADASGQWKVQDGVLTEAIRNASQGKTVLLFLDEILRWKLELQDSLLDLLQTSVDNQGNEFHEVRTPHMINGQQEVLRCSADKLHIIGAGNREGNPITPAFDDRFHSVDVKYSESEYKEIVKSNLDSLGVKDVDAIADVYAGATTVSRRLYNEMRLRKPLTIRYLRRAVKLTYQSTGDAKADDVFLWMIQNMNDNHATWDARTGDQVPDSVEACKDVSSCLSI